MSMGADTGSKSIPTTEATEYNIDTVGSSSPEAVFTDGVETRSLLLAADPGNGDLIFFGFDDNVSSGRGVALQAGQSIAIGHDASEQNIFVIANSGTQAYQFAALR